DDVAGVGSPLPHLALLFSPGNARRVLRDEKEGNPVVAVLRLRFGENQVQIGDSPVGDEALPAIYDPFVPPPDRPGPDGADIGAGPRLGKADGPEAGLLRIAQESEPPSLLLLRP